MFVFLPIVYILNLFTLCVCVYFYVYECFYMCVYVCVCTTQREIKKQLFGVIYLFLPLRHGSKYFTC